MENYELMLVFKPSLPENIRKGIQDRIATMIKQRGGDISTVDAWGKRYLAYPVKRHAEGYYMLLQVTMAREHMVNLDRGIRLIPDVIRHTFFKVEKKSSPAGKAKKQESVSSAEKVEAYLENIDDIYSTKI